MLSQHESNWVSYRKNSSQNPLELCEQIPRSLVAAVGAGSDFCEKVLAFLRVASLRRTFIRRVYQACLTRISSLVSQTKAWQVDME
jgi:hypothetical protein